ncbi:phytanoyl-CoA dioxygenase family protein [uncultured Azohydromonas sp.]|jgi:Protein involved in biosynthesis of mitomycin antibiotics/polyketide fumonisin|uniref:phytanoyl-CoA dioxygenase family protein n=1 Tax=uncultured Azohydromonas sp. TaxID=487342 RepID=UPI00261BB595|nr:phytanoyl-CoA dioxygenase family protein [uncultured Azohydromonas sp.]
MNTPTAGGAAPPQQQYDTAAIMGGLYGDGIIALRGAFERAWVERLREDIEALFEEAKRRPRGALPRGPERWYVEVHPERLRGFVDIVSHPWFVAVCRAVLGPDYKVIEVGFDMPGPGAQDQPWHRDFPMPDATRLGRRLNSLAFNLTAVDTTPEMGPFEVAPGTQWDEFGLDAEATGRRELGMFPPREWFPRYEARRQVRMAQMGDISARSALTIHRGTANRSDRSRPVLVVGVDAPDARNGERHDIQLTPAYAASLPEEVRRHLGGRVVEKLEYIEQAHAIEGLLKSDY